jgi:Protein of unknown function (DUF742)
MTTPDPNRPPAVRPYVSGPAAEPSRPARGRDPMVVRPYLITGGRAASAEIEFEIETQVVTTPTGEAALPGLRLEQRDIVALCLQPMAIAEIATRLGLHLGVVRVLVGDLIAANHVTAHRPRVGLHRDLTIIERVIHGLQTIG